MFKIIIVDDEKLERDVLKNFLVPLEDVRLVGEGKNGEEAIELCKNSQVNMVFLNYKMSKTNGMEAAQFIKNYNDDTIVILTTAHYDVTFKDNYDNLNVEGFLLKPIRPAIFIDMINKYKNLNIIKNTKKSNDNKLSTEILEAINYIEKYYRKNISLEYISQKVFLSPYYFSRTFKKETGINFSDYLTRKKIEEAKKLLISTDKSISDISLELSYKEQSYFSKVFREKVGFTPKEYRNNLNF